MRESCEIGHSFAHLYRREKSALSRLWRLRFGRGRPLHIKVKNSSLGLRDHQCLLHDGGEWVSDRGDSSAGGIVLAQIQNVGKSVKNWIGNPLVPVVCLTDVGGIAQEGPAVGPRCVVKEREGGPTWVFLFTRVIRVNETKSPKNL